MLVSFKAKNYKSFKDMFEFSMTAAPRIKDIDYSIRSIKVGSKNIRALSSSVVYGPNASGKTNIIGAMDTFKAIVERGNIQNDDKHISPNVASHSLELIPFIYSDENDPTSFEITFFEKGLLFQYSLSFKLGAFLNVSFNRRIVGEILSVNGKPLFTRTENGISMALDSVKPFLNSNTASIDENALELAKASLADDELFLTGGFKAICSKELANTFLNWLQRKFIVIYHSDEVQSRRVHSNARANTIYIENSLLEAAKVFGITGNSLGYKYDKEGNGVLYSVFEPDKISKAVSSDVFESFGTIRFINEFPIIVSALCNGGTLVMDEFDASIHPMALMNIIAIFHNDEINKNGAQLIFNTHNPIFLDADLFRRDEIKFVDRDRESCESILYSLSDFKKSGKSAVSKTDNYMNNYFIDRYGAIREVDFSDIIERIIDRASKDE